MHSRLHVLVKRGDVEGVRAFFAEFGNGDVNSYDDSHFSPLMHAVKTRPSPEITKLLLDHGADVHQETLPYADYPDWRPSNVISLALTGGHPGVIRALIQSGANLNSCGAWGSAAGAPDEHIFEVFEILVENGVSMDGLKNAKSTMLDHLSREGRFSVVKYFVASGLDPACTGWTPLIQAVAIGSLEEVDALIKEGARLEDRDKWNRTAWLVAVLSGDVPKADLLRKAGANMMARGHCEYPTLHYAVRRGCEEMLGWLLELGMFSPEETDKFGDTALMKAVEEDNPAAVDLLLRAGAQVDSDDDGETALHSIKSREVGLRLLEAGADPGQLTYEGRRHITGLGEARREVEISREEFLAGRFRRFGSSNPERMDVPYWTAMIRSGTSGFWAYSQFDINVDWETPTWSANRFGQSITFLPDERIVLIGGEHEDSYDPDFCIYNDVFVHHPDGRIEIFGYPEEVFPPTDFHTANLVGDYIWIVGSLGYGDKRLVGFTPVYRLDLRTMEIGKVATTGEDPGWIHGHTTTSGDGKFLRVTGGEVLRMADDELDFLESTDVFSLNLETLEWKKSS